MSDSLSMGIPQRVSNPPAPPFAKRGVYSSLFEVVTRGRGYSAFRSAPKNLNADRSWTALYHKLQNVLLPFRLKCWCAWYMKVRIAASLPGWTLESQGTSRYGTPCLFMSGLAMAEVVMLGKQVKG